MVTGMRPEQFSHELTNHFYCPNPFKDGMRRMGEPEYCGAPKSFFDSNEVHETVVQMTFNAIVDAIGNVKRST